MTTLASVSDLASYLDITIAGGDPRATLLLQLATAAIQNETRQHLFHVDDDTVTLTGGDTNRLLLPERPVTAVSAVTVDGVAVASTAWTLRGDEVLLRNGYSQFWSDYPNLYDRWPPEVVVTYSHGWVTIPDELRGVCVSAAARSYDNPRGLRSEQIGQYAAGYAGSGDILVPGVSLSADEVRTVRRVAGRRNAYAYVR